MLRLGYIGHSLAVARFPRVSAAGEVVLIHAGIQLGVLSVELWDERVTLQIAGVPIDAATGKREWDYWSRVNQSRSASTSEGGFAFPPHPTGSDHDALRVELADDQGTEYRFSGRGSAGVGWNFFGEVRFEPPVPGTVTELIVTFSIHGGPTATKRLRISDEVMLGGH